MTDQAFIGPREQRIMEEYARIGDPPSVRGVLRLWVVVLRIRHQCKPTVCARRGHPLAGLEVTHPTFGTVESCWCGQNQRTVY